jgi:hypothetical protein
VRYNGLLNRARHQAGEGFESLTFRQQRLNMYERRLGYGHHIFDEFADGKIRCIHCTGEQTKDSFKEHCPMYRYMVPRRNVYRALDSERAYQDGKWIAPGAPHMHSIGEWLIYMEQYIQEAKRALTFEPDPGANQTAINIVRKVTALGVVCMEQHGAPLREKKMDPEVASILENLP